MEEVATGGKSEENVSCFCEQVQTIAVSFVCCRFCVTYHFLLDFKTWKSKNILLIELLLMNSSEGLLCIIDYVFFIWFIFFNYCCYWKEWILHLLSILNFSFLISHLFVINNNIISYKLNFSKSKELVNTQIFIAVSLFCSWFCFMA